MLWGRLSIASKLYAIFALIATVTAALAAFTIVNARRHATLTDEYELTAVRAGNVANVTKLIFAMVMESRSIYAAPDLESAKSLAANLSKDVAQLDTVMEQWRPSLRDDDAADFRIFSNRLQNFRDFRRELVRRVNEEDLTQVRDWGQIDASAANQAVLRQDLEALTKVYAQRVDRIRAQIDHNVDVSAWLTVLLGLAALSLVTVGVLTISRSIARPLAQVTRLTEAVAGGTAVVEIPYCERRDEIGALARSVAVFQEAMHKNAALARTVTEDAEARSKRQEQITAEIMHFSADVEATLGELARIADAMLVASGHLSSAADEASSRATTAAECSTEASSNVRDIAAAADELAASVAEIDRQIAQSSAIAGKAANEAEQTNLAVQELDEAANRIGHVTRLINDIAEQTNLLALNATIEAARAGEAGRGFAVVANEVKALAGQTAKATGEIGAQIGGMQRATERSIAAISAIEHTIRELGDIGTAIAAAVTEQGAATEEIARSVETAARRTRDTAEQVGSVGEATGNTRSDAMLVKAVSDDLGAVATRIRGQVEQFFERLRAA